MKSLSKDLSYRTGCIRSREIVYLLGEYESFDFAHTVCDQWHKGELSGHLENIIYKSGCVSHLIKPQLVAVSGDGQYHVYGSGETFIGQIRPASDMKRKSGPFRRVQSVAGRPYAVGMDRVLFRYEGNKQWSRFDEGMPDGGNLESIAGLDEKLMYAVGWNGEIWYFDSSKAKLKQFEDPSTNIHLTCVTCADDGYAYIGGHDGILLKCNGPESICGSIGRGVTKGDFWDIAWFNGKLYASTLHSLYTLEGKDELVPVDFGDVDRPETFHHLSVADGVMWSIGQKDVVSFDGKKWTWIIKCDGQTK